MFGKLLQAPGISTGRGAGVVSPLLFATIQDVAVFEPEGGFTFGPALLVGWALGRDLVSGHGGQAGSPSARGCRAGASVWHMAGVRGAGQLTTSRQGLGATGR